jgi:hypothetical protein
LRDIDGGGPLLKLEKKADVIKRHGHSPDHWDSDVLAMRETTPPRMISAAGPRMLSRTNGRPKVRLKGARRHNGGMLT